MMKRLITARNYKNNTIYNWCSWTQEPEHNDKYCKLNNLECQMHQVTGQHKQDNILYRTNLN